MLPGFLAATKSGSKGVSGAAREEPDWHSQPSLCHAPTKPSHCPGRAAPGLQRPRATSLALHCHGITVRYRSVYFSLNCHCHFINKATRAPGGWEACPALHTGWRQSPAALWVACCPLDQCCSLFGLQLPLSFKKLLRTSRTLMKVMSLDIFQIKS